MTTIAEKLVLLDNTKTEIHNAIETMGVDVAVDLPFSGYPEKILQISSGGAADTWTPPADWIDISLVNDNEINLLVTEGTGIAFSVVTASGSYSIDWGDGIVEIDRVSGTIYQHQHLINGTPCSLGYNTWKVRIFGATADITRWKIEKHSYTVNTQYSTILSANFGTFGITSYESTFSSLSVYSTLLRSCVVCSFGSVTTVDYMFGDCYALVSVKLPVSWGSVTTASTMFVSCFALGGVILPASWGSVTNLSDMFAYCYALVSVTLPVSWGSVTDLSYMFASCFALGGVILPASWGSVTNLLHMFSDCFALGGVTLPVSWGSVTNLSYMFEACSALVSVTLPISWGSVTNLSFMFRNCDSLWLMALPASWGSVRGLSSMFYRCRGIKTIENLHFLGSLTAPADFTNFMTDCTFVQQDIVINSLISKIDINGFTLGNLLKINSIRLTNSGSLFAGSSPQINVSYTSMSATALDLLFGDLPVLSGKNILISGCPGAVTCNRGIATAKGWTVINN